jgi:hypothetical protein
MTLGELKVLEAAHEAHPSCVLARPQLASDLGEAAALQEPSDHDPPLSLRHGLKAGLKGSGDRAAVAVVARGRIRNESQVPAISLKATTRQPPVREPTEVLPDTRRQVHPAHRYVVTVDVSSGAVESSDRHAARLSSSHLSRSATEAGRANPHQQRPEAAFFTTILRRISG